MIPDSMRLQRLIGLVLLAVMFSASPSTACTSFMVDTDSGLFFVHSLNFGSVDSIPGSIFINQRDAWKYGYSWNTLTNPTDRSAPSIVWKSKYGSITFNPFGRELPDGGMNEAGLYIWEMGFDTQYPDDPDKPMLFQCQWMQYVLDNLSTSDEVIDNAHRMSLDGWGWHYFVADKSGKTAIIDFIDGKPKVYTGDQMPVPLCCNSSYDDAMEWLKLHKGFGGDLEITQGFDELPRFVYGAKLLHDRDFTDPVEFGFKVLDDVSKNVRWSVVFDVANMTTYWKTNVHQTIRHFTVSPDDFESDGSPLTLHVEYVGSEDARSAFEPCTSDRNRAMMKTVYGMMCDLMPQFRKSILDDPGVDIDEFVRNVDDRMQVSGSVPNLKIQGEWRRVSMPHAVGAPQILTLRGRDDALSGSLVDGISSDAFTLTNVAYDGGLLSFTVAVPETGDIYYYKLHATVGELHGSAESWKSDTRLSLSLARDASNDL